MLAPMRFDAGINAASTAGIIAHIDAFMHAVEKCQCLHQSCNASIGAGMDTEVMCIECQSLIYIDAASLRALPAFLFGYQQYKAE